MRWSACLAAATGLAVHAAAVAQLPPATLAAPGASAVFRENPNGPLTDRDIEFVAKKLTYSAGRPQQVQSWTESALSAAPTEATIRGDKAFRDSLKANNFSYVDSIDTGKGFQAILIKDNATGRVVMSVRGTEFGATTEGVKDVGADAATVATLKTGQAHPGLPQYDAEVKKWVAEKMAEHKGNVIVTGHSLGGAHAQRIVLDHADKIVSAQTYNAPALETTAIEPVVNDPKRMRTLFDDKGRPKVRHFAGTGDPVSGAGSLHIPGDVVVASGGNFDNPGLLGAHSLMINEPGVRRREMTVEEYNRIRRFTQVNTREYGSFLAHVGVETVRVLTELHPAVLYHEAAGEPTVRDLEARYAQARLTAEKRATINDKLLEKAKREMNDRDKANLALAKEQKTREATADKLTVEAIKAAKTDASADVGPAMTKDQEERADRERKEAAERKKARERKQAKERVEQAALLAAAAQAQKDLDLPTAAVPDLPPLSPPPPPTPQEIAEVVAAFQALQQQEAQRQQALAAAFASFGAMLSQSFAAFDRRSRSKPAASAPAAPSKPSAPSRPSCCCGRC